jgi:hypothetical protein
VATDPTAEDAFGEHREAFTGKLAFGALQTRLSYA